MATLCIVITYDVITNGSGSETEQTTTHQTKCKLGEIVGRGDQSKANGTT